MRSVHSLVAFLLVVAGLLAFTAKPAHGAGTLCGVVRDAATTDPVEGAGIFVFTTTGSYTGFHAASDADGAFCIPDIPAGTYDLQIRRDCYLTSWVRGVDVLDDVTAVDIGVQPLAGALLPPTPNPARNQVQFRFRLLEPAPVRLEVLDAQGRMLKGWRQGLASAGEHTLAWDFRNAEGRTVPAGRYFVRFRVAGSTITRAFARVP